MRNGESFPDKHLDRLLAAQAILDKNPEKKIGIKELAHQVGWNRTELANAFKQYFNQTIKVYQLALRIKSAQHLLETTHNPVKRISQQVGYKSDSNFSVAFKREMGISPINYRRSMNGLSNGQKPSKKRTK
jgi:transcriptional regulator GlxA family with amidase domain